MKMLRTMLLVLGANQSWQAPRSFDINLHCIYRLTFVCLVSTVQLHVA
jgi:hypothetical protein